MNSTSNVEIQAVAAPSSSEGDGEAFCPFTEEQATLITTMSQNTPQVTTSFPVDLASFDTITGTWHWIAMS